MSGFFALLGNLVMLLFFGAPIYMVHWTWNQKSHAKSITLGVSYLCVWLMVFASLVAYFFSGAWYGENTPLSQNIIEGAIALGVFVVFPVTAILHLRSKARDTQTTEG